MADQIAHIVRGLNAVRTIAQAKVAIGEALNALGAAYNLGGLTEQNRHALDLARAPLEQWWKEIRGLKDTNASGQANPYPEWPARRNLVERAYIEISGVDGELNAKKTVSFGSELLEGTRDVAAGVGKLTAAVASGVGETAGAVLGGLLSGLGPLVLIVAAVAIFFTWKAKAKG